MVWIVLIGFVVGFVARLLTPGSGPRGFLLSATLGIGGALAATWLGRVIGLYTAGQSAGFIGAVFGAVVSLLSYQLIAKR